VSRLDHRRLAERLQTALALHESGVAMKRAQILRQNPDASVDEIARRLNQWLRERPGAEQGDAVGVPRKLPHLSG
jgi:hypothetical protein